MYLKVRDVDLVQTADSGTFKEPRSDLTAVLYDGTKIAQVNAPGRMVRILTRVTSDASLLQKGDEAAFGTPGFLYALIGWRPQRQVQAVVLRLHDVLGLASHPINERPIGAVHLVGKYEAEGNDWSQHARFFSFNRSCC